MKSQNKLMSWCIPGIAIIIVIDLAFGESLRFLECAIFHSGVSFKIQVKIFQPVYQNFHFTKVLIIQEISTNFSESYIEKNKSLKPHLPFLLDFFYQE
jgi:hypothetical protein